jgi:hypothetical protein
VSAVLETAGRGVPSYVDLRPPDLLTSKVGSVGGGNTYLAYHMILQSRVFSKILKLALSALFYYSILYSQFYIVSSI